MSLQVVQSGPLRFRTKADLDQLRLAFVAKTPAYGLTLTGSSINGQSYQFGNGTYTEEEFGDILAAAYQQLGITQYGDVTPRTSTARLC